jgi:hypothetical protein
VETGWGSTFVQRFTACADDHAVATIWTRAGREFLARRDDIEVLPTFPVVWIINGDQVVPESEIVRVKVTGDLREGA